MGRGNTHASAVAAAKTALEQSEKQFRDLVEGSIQGLYIHRDWNLLFANQALADMFGYSSAKEILDLKDLAPLIAPSERPRLRDYNRRRESGGTAPEQYEARCLKKNGKRIWAEFRVKLVEWRGVPAVQCAVVDITERKNAERTLRRQNEELRKRDIELRTQNERFNAALANMSQGLCMFDHEQRLVVCNDRYIAMYGLPPELAAPGTSFREIIEHRIKSGVYAGEQPEKYIQERLAAVMEDAASTKVQQLTDGRIIAIVHQPMPGGGWVATHEDTTELQRIEAQISHMAHHDALTDLPNRTLLRERIKDALTLTRCGRGSAVLCLDLDRFKSVNDALGHSGGDELLKQVTQRLLGCVRQSDTVARIGGDEFVIVQTANDQPRSATLLASRICDAIKKPFDLQGHQIATDTSIGIALAPNDGTDPDQLLRSGDLALYKAKADGRGVFRFFEPEMDARIKARRELELGLRRGLEAGEFALHYQPLVNLESNEISGFEALLRWTHPQRGLVQPAEFIPLAEETGFIQPLGEWVVRQACNDAATWPDHVSVAINLSPTQFRSPGLVPLILNALGTSGIAPARLELEITESVLLQNNETTLQTLHQLREVGVRIVMDDFGTGYSSLSYLRSFPFDKIKIDRSFIGALSEGEDAIAIVRAVASLSRSLGMTTTAEGVETEDQLERVRTEGYTEMQGFLFCSPKPAEEVSRIFFPQSGIPRQARTRR